MLNYIWMVMLAAGFITGMLNGRIEEVTKAALDSSGKAIELSIGLLGIMCLWSGLMNISEKCGIVEKIARFAKPVLKLLFPQAASDRKALGAIVMNLAANFLGLGNAATPLGIKAMNELQRNNPHKETASDSMCMFLVLNTSAIQLIPTTVIALRSAAGSQAPSEITVCVWISSFCAVLAGITAVMLLSGISSKERRRKGLARKAVKGRKIKTLPAIRRN